MIEVLRTNNAIRLDYAMVLLKQAGCVHIRALVLVASPDAIARLEQQHPDVDVYAAVIDSHLDANGYIIPGLGDAGDRIMGTLAD